MLNKLLAKWEGLKILDKVLVISFSLVVFLFGLYMALNQQPTRHYYFPEDFCGWVTIKYEKPGVPPLSMENGAMIYSIPSTGIMETSSRLKAGWGRDVFFRKENGKYEKLPGYVDGEKERLTFIHEKSYSNQRFDSILVHIPDHTDTVIFDGTTIEREGREVNVRTGRKTLQHFYVSCEALPFFSKVDSLPEEREFW